MRRRLYLCVYLVGLACAGSLAASMIRSTRDQSDAAKMTEKMSTVGAGRYLVDVPSQAEVSFSGAILDGFSVDTLEESDGAFRERVAVREAEIAAGGPAIDGSGGMVDARDLAIPGMTGRTLIYGRHRAYWFEGGRRVDDEWAAVEVHAHTKGVGVSLATKTGDEATAAAAEALLASLEVRGKDELPAGAGFCIWRAMFVEPLPAHKSEQLVMHLGLNGHPDVGLTVSSIGGSTPESSLSTRVMRAEAGMSVGVLLRMNKMRDRKRTINGIEAEEVLVRAREVDLTTSDGFSWDAPGVSDVLLQPYLSLELRTGRSERAGGKPVESSLHDDALLALWDSIASSIRLHGVASGRAAH